MAPGTRGAHEEESIQGRADGRDPARSGPRTVAEVAKKHMVSASTIYAWRKHFGQLDVSDVKLSMPSSRVIELLSRLVSLHGAPLFMRSDNGPEFVSQAIRESISSGGSATVLNDPGKPWQNGTDESFNGKFCDECLPIEWFRSHREAAVIIESWRQHHNEVRPRGSLQYLTPVEFKQQLRQDKRAAVH
jgi:transposase InsO family protein